MSWEPNKPTETYLRALKKGEFHSFSAKLSLLEAWEAHSRNYWSTLKRQSLGSWKGAPASQPSLWLYQSDTDCIMFKGNYPNYSFRLSSLYGDRNQPIFSKLAIKDCLLSWKTVRMYSQSDNGHLETQMMPKWQSDVDEQLLILMTIKLTWLVKDFLGERAEDTELKLSQVSISLLTQLNWWVTKRNDTMLPSMFIAHKSSLKAFRHITLVASASG